jgi:phasin
MAPKKIVSPAAIGALEGAPAEVENAVEAAPGPAVAFQDLMRQSVEKTVSDSGAAYSRAKAAADEAVNALETSVNSASKGVVDFHSKALDVLRAHFDANIDFAKAAMNVKTFGDFVSLQSQHATKQAEALAAQAKEFGMLAQRIATETSEPIKSQVVKTFKLSA